MSGTWGDTVNNGITSLIETSLAGYTSIAMTDANYTLSQANGAADEARSMMINMTGTLTANRNVVCPNVNKMYVFRNSTTGGFSLVLKTSGGTGVTVPAGKTITVFCDGADNIFDATSYFSGAITVNGAFTTNSTITGGSTTTTGIFSAPLGSVSAPSYTFTGDTNTGTWSPGADTLAWSTGGSERMRIDSSGRIGIGVAPTSTLDINGNVTLRGNITGASTAAAYTLGSDPGIANGGLLQLFGSTAGTPNIITAYTSGAERMRIDASGNVGIGGAPQAPLDVVRSATDAIIAVRGPAAFSAALQLQGAGVGSGSAFMLQQDSGAAALVFNRSNTAMFFGTNNTERMRIDASGNVGIGGAPGAKLNVIGVAANTLVTISETTGYGLFRSANTGNNAYFGSDSSAGAVGGVAYATLLWSNNAVPILFGTNNTERMRIDASGNVGIGGAPGDKLDVNGNIRVTGAGSTRQLGFNFFGSDRYNFYVDGSVDADRLTIRKGSTTVAVFDTSGNVGIGAAPATRLHAFGASAIARIESSGDQYTQLQIKHATRQWAVVSGPSSDPYFYLEDTTGGRRVLQADFSGNVGIGAAPASGKLDVYQTAGLSRLSVKSDSAQSAAVSIAGNGTTPGTTAFDLFNDSAAASIYQRANLPMLFGTNNAERMRIDASGNVGIGASPVYQFQVRGATQAVAAPTDAGNKGGTLYLQDNVGGVGNGGTLLIGTTLGNATPFAAIKGYVTDGATNTKGDLVLSTRNAVADTALTERLRITSAGVIQDGAGLELGYKDIPRTTGGLTRGQAYATAAGFTVNTGSAAGSAYSVYNDSAAAFTITQGSGLTLRQGGTTNTGNRTLAARGFATIWFNSTTEAVISGSGIT